MLTADYVVQYLVQRMGGDEKQYGLQWVEYEDGYASIVNNVMLYMRTAHTRTGAFIVLSLFKDGKEAHIWEPEIHFSQAPIGKMWEAITKFLSLPSPKGPTTPQEWENERLRINLNKLMIRASNQTDLEARAPDPVLRALIERHKKMFHDEGYWRYTEEQYESMKQELFRVLTLGE